MTSRDTYDILTYEEEKEESMNGINIQINTLVDAMIDAEKCLFHNSTANLIVNSLLNEEGSLVVKEIVVPLAFRGAHPNFPANKKSYAYEHYGRKQPKRTMRDLSSQIIQI